MKRSATLFVVALAGAAIGQQGTPPNQQVTGAYMLRFADEFQTQFFNADGSQVDESLWEVQTRGNPTPRAPRNALVDTTSEGGIGFFSNTVTAALPDEGPQGQLYSTAWINTHERFGPGSFFVWRSRPIGSPGVQTSGFFSPGNGTGIARQRHPSAPTSLDPLVLDDWVVEFEVPDGPPHVTLDSSSTFPYPGEDDSFAFPGIFDLSAQFTTYGLHWTEAGDYIYYVDFNDNGLFSKSEVVGRSSILPGIAVESSFVTSMSVNEGQSDGQLADHGVLHPDINIFGRSADTDYVRVYEKTARTLAGESFDYAGAIGAAESGQGWIGPWNVESGAASVAGDGMSLRLSGIELFAPTGNALTLDASDGVLSRVLENPIAMNVEGGEHWFAMLCRRSPTAGIDVGIRTAENSSIVRLGFGITESGEPYAEVFDPTNGAPGLPADETLLIIARTQTVNDPTMEDVTSVAVFRDGDAIPLSAGDIAFDVTDGNGGSTTLRLLDIQATGSGEVIIDEFRIASTFAQLIESMTIPIANESFDGPAGSAPAGSAADAGWDSEWFEDTDGPSGTARGPAIGEITSPGLAQVDGSNTGVRSGIGDRLATSNVNMLRLMETPFGLSRGDETLFMTALVKQSAGSRLTLGYEDAIGNMRGVVTLEDGVTVTADAGAVVESTDLTLFSASAPPPNGSNRFQPAFGGAWERELTNQARIQGPTGASDRHIAFLVSRETDGGFALRFKSGPGNEGFVRCFLQAEYDSEDLIFGFQEEVSGTVGTLPGALPFGETKLVIAHFQADGDPNNTTDSDRIRVAVFDDGDAIPSVDQFDGWQGEVAGNTSLRMNWVELTVNEQLGSGASEFGAVAIDELRITARFDDAASNDVATTIVAEETFPYAPGAPLDGQGDAENGFLGPWDELSLIGGPDIVAGSLDYPERGGVVPGDTLLLVTRLISRSDLALEQFDVKFFGSDGVPVDSNVIDFDVSAVAQSGVSLDFLRLIVENTAGGTTEVDEIHIATTLEQAMGELRCSAVDFDGDGKLTETDVLMFLSDPFDINFDGAVDAFDVIDMLSVFDAGGC